MNNRDILMILKIDLQISSDKMDDYLENKIEQARDRIKREGITLGEESISDGMLLSDYAAHLYRHRKTGEPMPRDLRWALNNRLMSEKGRG